MSTTRAMTPVSRIEVTGPVCVILANCVCLGIGKNERGLLAEDSLLPEKQAGGCPR